MSEIRVLTDDNLIATTANGGKGFTQEQKTYLAEMLVKMNLHELLGAGDRSEKEDALPTFWGTPLDDLCKEEKAKYETHVLDIWDWIVRHDNDNRMPEGIVGFMFRHFGLFNVAPAMDGYMCRMRIPACKLRGDQLVGLGDIAQHIAGGYAHVTTRGNFQLREIPANKALELLAAFYDLGLSCKGSGADSARNITASPTDGFDENELIAMQKYAIDFSHVILNTRDFHGLPRKFNFAFDNAGSISCVSDTNDVGFVATKVLENNQGVAPGIYCRLVLGGISGHKDFARDTGFVCLPHQTPKVAEAILQVYLEHGDRTNRKKARFKYVLDAHGFDWVCERIQEKLDEMDCGVVLQALDSTFQAPRPAIQRQAHIGVHKQKQAGLNYIGVALKLGRMSPDQMRAIGRIAMRYGANDIRLTVWQNLLIPHIPDADVDAVVKEIEALGLSVNANAFAAGAIACTGRWACKLANAYTKQDAERIVDHLQSRFTLDNPINIHLTGCPNSCAQHYIGDIGLIGTTASDGSEGYNIFVGGGTDDDQGLARFLCGPVAARDVCDIAEKIVGNYLQKRQDDVSFLSFTRQLEDSQLEPVLLAN